MKTTIRVLKSWFVALSVPVLALALLCGAVSRATGALVGNGGFEAPVLNVGSNLWMTNGFTLLAGWNVSIPPGAGAMMANGTVYGTTPSGAAEGAQFIAFNQGLTDPGSSIYQDFSTTTGLTYSATFNVGRAVGPQAILLRLQIQDPATGLPDFSADFNAPGSPGWSALQTYTWVASRTVTRLAFIDVSAPAAGTDLLLDNVSVVAILPALNIAVAGSSLVQVTWTTNSVGFQLEECTNLTVPAWAAVTNIPAVADDHFVLIMDSIDPQRFFHLRK